MFGKFLYFYLIRLLKKEYLLKMECLNHVLFFIYYFEISEYLGRLQLNFLLQSDYLPTIKIMKTNVLVFLFNIKMVEFNLISTYFCF